MRVSAAARSAETRRPLLQRSSRCLALIVAATLAWLGARAGAGRADDLPARLAAALTHPGLRGAKIGALVVRADDGRVLFERGADQSLIPASNLKILTGLAALASFGPAHRFTTRVSVDAPPDADGTVGALAVRGGGDPALTSEEWWRLAADLRRRGLRRVHGDLILDDTYFDQQRWNTAWDAVSARAFHAPVGALTANYGSFAVEVEAPSRSGAPARIALDPPVPFFTLVDRTAAGGGALAVERERAGARDRVVGSGAPPASGEPVTIFRSVSDPVRYAAAVLRAQLAAQAIAVDGADRIAPVPPGFREILAFDGKPLADIVRLLMKYSNNNTAEMLVKDLGAAQSGPPGTWANGIAAVRQQLVALGLSASGFQIVDGSGLSPANRVTPRTLVDALRIARASFAFGPELESALPIAARDGTLGKRAADAADAVRAKTGLLSGAAALSGFARGGDGTTLVFSLLVNDYKRGDADAIAGIDGFAATLVQ